MEIIHLKNTMMWYTAPVTLEYPQNALQQILCS